MKREERLREIREFVADTVEDRGAVPKSWLVNEIVKRHSHVEGPDRGWMLSCAYAATDADVRRVLGDMKFGEQSGQPEQGDLFPGCDMLQKRYVIERDGNSTVVAIEAMTDEEIETKALEHERASEGHLRHAQELRRFAEQRRAITGAA